MVELIAERFRTMGEPTRIRILERLQTGEASVQELAEHVGSSQQNAVVVRTPDAAALVPLLEERGATVDSSEPGVLVVHGIGAQEVGDLAFEHRIRLHELSARTATLEEAFLERTAGSEEFLAQPFSPEQGGGAR